MILWKNYILNLVTLLIWLQIHAIYFIVFAMKQVVFVLAEENAHCKFCSLFFTNNGLDNMSLEEFLIRNRNIEQNLLMLVDLFWPYFRKMRIFKPEALIFFKKEYRWTFRNYRNYTDLSMTLQEVIDSTDELIKLSGEEAYCQILI